jgi:colanic acid/amylovoran biosynthesis protein
MLKNEGIGLKGHTLGITVSSIVEKRFNKSHDGKNFIKEIAAMLDQIIDSLDISVLFVGHVTGPSEQKDDRLTAKRVHQAMKNQKKAFVLNGNYRPDELKGVIARCDVFIGARMHSNIAALSTTVPTLAIGYSHKTQGIMSSAGMSKYVYNIDNLDTNKIYKDLVSVYKNRTHIANDLKKSATFLKAESRKNLDIIRELTEASV